MKIGVISDTHGGLEGYKKAMEILDGVRMVLHAGDILNHGPVNPFPSAYGPKELINLINDSRVPILAAKGNCDSEVDELLLKIIIQPMVFFQDQELRILVQHGHTHDDEGRIELGKKYDLSIIISGHTHTPKIEEQDGIILLNPGSPSIALGGVLSCGEIDHQDGQLSIRLYDLEGKVLAEHSHKT